MSQHDSSRQKNYCELIKSNMLPIGNNKPDDGSTKRKRRIKILQLP